MTDNLLTVQEVANRLNVSRPTVYRLVKKGKIQHIKVEGSIRIKPGDLESFIERQTTPAIAD
jgi:excisionase family DNA binding protein